MKLIYRLIEPHQTTQYDSLYEADYMAYKSKYTSFIQVWGIDIQDNEADPILVTTISFSKEEIQ